MKWLKGRQHTGYERLTFVETKRFDLHLIRYLKDTYIPDHKDPVKGYNHYRLNILLKGEDSFVCSKVIFKFWRFTLFRPDLYTHSVPAVKTSRYLLSIGWTTERSNEKNYGSVCSADE